MLSFAIKSAIYLSIMYIPYMLLLRNESFFRFNRVLLICIMLLSLILPFCDLHALAIQNNPFQQGMIQVGMPIAVVERGHQFSDPLSGSISWMTIISYAYLIGVLAIMLYKVFQMAMLYRTIHKGVLWTDVKDGVTIYCHANDIVPFSWFRTIVISEQDYTENAEEIIGHEMGHILHHHSWDILLVNICEVIQWMNPLIWILASSLRNVHEYEADDAVLRSGVNARQYQTLLIRKAVGFSSYTFANSFNHSQLKKRFTMMFRKESNPWMRTKALYIIPVAVIALSAFATPELNNRVDVITEDAPSVFADKGTKNSVNNQKKAELIAVTEKVEGKKAEAKEEAIEKASLLKAESSDNEHTQNDNGQKTFDVVENMPSFPGGMREMMSYVAKNIKYPEIAHKANVQGRVIVEFVVEKDGSICEVKTKNFKQKEVAKAGGNNTEATPEDYAQAYQATKALTDEAERVVCSMPKWTPGTQNGEPARVRFFVPITFNLN